MLVDVTTCYWIVGVVNIFWISYHIKYYINMHNKLKATLIWIQKIAATAQIPHYFSLEILQGCILFNHIDSESSFLMNLGKDLISWVISNIMSILILFAFYWFILTKPWLGEKLQKGFLEQYISMYILFAWRRLKIMVHTMYI